MGAKTMQKNTAFRRVKYLTLMQIGDGVRDLRNGSKGKLIAKLCLKTLLAMVMMAVFIVVFGLLGSIFQLPPTRDMLITLLLVTQIVSVISCLSSMMLTLFASKENTMLLAFPCNYSEIFLSKIIVFSLEEMKKNVYFILPLLVGFGMNGGAGIAFWLQLPIMWLALCLLPVFMGAMLSIPAIFIKRFLQNHVWLYAVLMVLIFGGMFFSIFTVLSSVRPPINIVAVYNQFIAGVKQGFVTVNKFALFYNWIGKALYGESVFLFLPLTLAALIGLGVACFLAAMPFYFKAASATNENSTTKQHQLSMSKKGGLFGTFFRKELKIQLRTFQSVNSILIVVFLFPLITYVFNFLMAAINTDVMGQHMTVSFNMMIILSLLGTHNSNSAASISMEGNEFAVLKTAPSNTSVIAWAKLAVTGLVNLASLCMMACMLMMTSRTLSTLDIVLLMGCILCVSLGQIAWGFEFDIRKPKITEYATKGDGVTDNGNIAKAMAIAFLVSTLFGIIGLLFMLESYLFGWLRLVGLSVGFLAARFYLLRSNLKVYFEDIQG